ncbi:energy transducer TonB [Pedobacter soli]|uniref:TonB family C-terminal domain-containing protein n=1 Tax=Pedobacter soli TaxID=390242 RepID=A0A1G6PLR5_9SPHI|nr:energy transducer TonB [Pedobacter soli]SDC81123.1 TonB family C-terminal domain-containing protein [Pedobacter soli]
MKAFYLFFLCFSISVGCIAQQSDTLITYNFGGKPTTKLNKATSLYKVFKQDSVTWIRITSDKNFMPLKRETFSDSTLTNLYGTYTLYKNGKPHIKGTYLNNEKAGTWITYGNESNAIETKVYAFNLLNGLYVSYWPNSAVFEQKEYVNDREVGERKLFYQNGNLALKEVFDDKGQLIDSAYFDQEGNVTLSQTIIILPQYPGGIKKLYELIAKELKYPEDALRISAQGKVFLSFTVGESGELSNIQLIRAPYPSLGEEAMRVLKYLPKWIPGTMLGRPTAMQFNINVDFTIGKTIYH